MVNINFSKSKELYLQALETYVNGVGSDERAGIKPHPIYMTHGKGSHLFDIDGNEYIDYQMGFGCLIQGHCPQKVVEAVQNQVALCSVLGTATELEIEATKRICKLVRSVETVRFSNSGSEAVQGALRTARAYTGKRKIIKFEGHYHGWFDSINISHIPAKLEEIGNYSSPTKVLATVGQTDSGLNDIIILPWNDSEILGRTIAKYRDEIAAVITEPILFNCSIIMPSRGYLEYMREVTTKNDVLLIFDEIQTGFRVALGGAQEYFGVYPDITIMAKALANGFPVSAYGGKKRILEEASTKGMVHVGTYNSNPIVLAAICANLDELSSAGGSVYREMGKKGIRLRKGLVEIYKKAGLPARDAGPETAFSIMLYDGEQMKGLRDYYRCDLATLDSLRNEFRKRGVYLRPSLRDMWYMCTAHTNDDIDKTLQVAEEVVSEVVRKK